MFARFFGCFGGASEAREAKEAAVDCTTTTKCLTEGSSKASAPSEPAAAAAERTSASQPLDRSGSLTSVSYLQADGTGAAAQRKSRPSSDTLVSIPSMGRLSLTTEQIQLVPPLSLMEGITLVKFLGAGSFAHVYLGEWMGAPVAIKFVTSDSLTATSSCMRETMIGSNLHHPNVVHTYLYRCTQLTSEWLLPFLSSGTHKRHSDSRAVRSMSGPGFLYSSGEGFGDPFHNTAPGKPPLTLRDVLLGLPVFQPGLYVAMIVMEYCTQGSLATAAYRGLFRHNRTSPRVALRALYRTAQEVAGGMMQVHGLGVVHADLKAANVLLMDSRRDKRGFVAKVADFGLSRVVGGPAAEVTSEWSTIAYMAPEFLDGTVSKAADVYSFGILLWEMYAGRRAYTALAREQIVAGVLLGTLRPAWEEGTPLPLVALAQQCWAQDPQKRPSFEEIVYRLKVMENNLRMELLNSSNTESESSPASNESDEETQQGAIPNRARPKSGPQQGVSYHSKAKARSSDTLHLHMEKRSMVAMTRMGPVPLHIARTTSHDEQQVKSAAEKRMAQYHQSSLRFSAPAPAISSRSANRATARYAPENTSPHLPLTLRPSTHRGHIQPPIAVQPLPSTPIPEHAIVAEPLVQAPSPAPTVPNSMTSSMLHSYVSPDGIAITTKGAPASGQPGLGQLGMQAEYAFGLRATPALVSSVHIKFRNDSAALGSFHQLPSTSSESLAGIPTCPQSGASSAQSGVRRLSLADSADASRYQQLQRADSADVSRYHQLLAADNAAVASFPLLPRADMAAAGGSSMHPRQRAELAAMGRMYNQPMTDFSAPVTPMGTGYTAHHAMLRSPEIAEQQHYVDPTAVTGSLQQPPRPRSSSTASNLYRQLTSDTAASSSFQQYHGTPATSPPVNKAYQPPAATGNFSQLPREDSAAPYTLQQAKGAVI